MTSKISVPTHRKAPSKMLTRSTKQTTLGTGVMVLAMVLASCGESQTANVPAQAPLDTLPAVAPQGEPPEGTTPIHQINALLLGAPTVNHLEIAAAPLVEQCMADAGFDINLGAPEPGPATYGERKQAAAENYVPPAPFFIEDATADTYQALGDKSEDEQARFATALEGTDEEFGCAETGRLAAASPLLLTPEQQEEHGEFIMNTILSPSMKAAEEAYAACVAESGIDVNDSGDIATLTIDASVNGDDKQAAMLFALNDRCATDTIDVAEAEAARTVIGELQARGVLDDRTASLVLGT